MAGTALCIVCKNEEIVDDLDLCEGCTFDLMQHRCRGCGKPCPCEYCEECVGAGRADCAHGNPPGECNTCDINADLAYDAAREGRHG